MASFFFELPIAIGIFLSVTMVHMHQAEYLKREASTERCIIKDYSIKVWSILEALIQIFVISTH